MYIVIRAGGVGTRLWPISRIQKPKQLHALTTQKTLLQESIDRIVDIADIEHIYVSCNVHAETATRQGLGSVLKNNVIVEPDLRETAAAVGLETIMIAKKDPEAVIASLGSDHVITNTEEFQRILKKAEVIINERPDHIVCIGVTPSTPDTGYGYIELADAITDEVYHVSSFKEKPNEVMAKQFLQAGNYLWNANMFVWRADTILKLFAEHQPEMYEKLMMMQANPERIPEVYPSLEKIAVDYAIIEKTNKLLAIPGNFGWNDIGDWGRLLDEVADPNTSNFTKGNQVDIESKNTLVFSDTKRIIATVGLDNIVIVDTEDALLICDKNRTQDVKAIVEKLRESGHTEVL